MSGFFSVGILPGMLFFSISTILYALYYLKTTFLPLENVFTTHHLLDSLKEPIPDLRKEQPLPNKVILIFTPKEESER